MDVLSWNCRGLGMNSKSQALKDFISQNRPSIVFLSETKIDNLDDFRRLSRTLQGLGFDHSQEVLSDGRSGGLGLFWKEGITLRIRSSSHRFIDAELKGDLGDPIWRLTGFYGHPTTNLRYLSWQAIKELSDEDSLPWVIVGDFNEILHADEKQDGSRCSERQMRGFRDVVGYADLVDLGYIGSRFTWSNRQTKLRLDRALATTTWNVLPPSISDHSPLFLQISAGPIVKAQRFHRFRFESFWLQHAECNQLVTSQWQLPQSGQPLFCISKKIMRTSKALDKWQRRTFIDRQNQMKEIRERLEELLDGPFSLQTNEEKQSLMLRLQQLTSQEESY
ncbi:hypothetical protein M0R45_009141 [Rubus argutus]|uniref:Endonuclease/exonuclease/phosphatase domain-containing protein n=1 Tax=Rubus argutus TaxID=59490 RepID=A0AAW1Y437_RUBAR